MAVTIYTSADASAPPLVPTTSLVDIVNVFKGCLVTGYGIKPGAGWAVPHEDATFTVLRPGAGARAFLQMRKSSYGAVIAFETMSAVNTGTNPSRADNAAFHDMIETARGGDTVTPRPWVMAADARTAHFFVDSGLDGGYGSFSFGDFYSYKAGDAYNSLMVPTIATKDTNPFKDYRWFGLNTTLGSTLGAYLVRSYTQAGLQVAGGLRGDGAVISSTNLRGVLPYPNPAGGQLWLAPIYINENGLVANRGKMRGLWHWLHPIAGVADRDTFAGTGEFAGKTFMIVKQALNFSPVDGLFVIETSDTWLTN